MNDRERADPALATRLGRLLSVCGPWGAYLGTAYGCTRYLNDRAKLVPKWGEWYMASEGYPYVLLQVRAFLSGRLALLRHATDAGNDFIWGRGGMHQAWGLGVPILAMPLHVLGRLFGAPGFPDGARFLVFYALTVVLLAHALHAAAQRAPGQLVPSLAATGFVMVFPTFVGLLSSRFLVYDQTVAVGVLWDVVLLAGVAELYAKSTPGRLAALCVAAGFAISIRATLGAYGLTTALLALWLAWRRRMRARALIGGVVGYVAGMSVFGVGNYLRFGSAFDPGYSNVLSGAFVNRLNRWGLPFEKLPFATGAKEMFATLFLLDPVPNQIMMGTPPEGVRPFAIGERWREYYSPTFDRVILALWTAAVGVVVWRVVRGRLWRRERDLRDEFLTVVGAWALPPSIVLFVFYSRNGAMVTRYPADMIPAFAAAALCAGMAATHAIRGRGPTAVASVQLALACVTGLYLSGTGWRGWAQNLSHPVDRATVVAQIATLDTYGLRPAVVPDRFKCNGPRGESPAHGHMVDWHGDCSFSSGMVFGMPHARCIAFTFRPAGNSWGAADDEALDGFRAKGDSDSLVRCGADEVIEGERRVTMCDPHPPRYLLDGMRLYSLATLDDKLNAIDRLKLMEIGPVPACPAP